MKKPPYRKAGGSFVLYLGYSLTTEYLILPLRNLELLTERCQ